MLNVRKKQAQCSLLLELNKKDDVPYALNLCEKFGVIKNAYSFSGVSDNVYVLLEFEQEECAKKLLLESHFKNILDAFPVLSRIIGYTRKYDQDEPKVSIKVIENNLNTIPIKEGTVSDLIEHIYNEEKLTELNVRLRFFFCCILKEFLSGPFPYCDVLPFGSSVNGIGRHGCDLDLMIRLYPEKIDTSSELYFVNKTCVGDIKNLQRRVVHCIGDLLRTFLPGITSVNKILHARVPIVKLDHKILGMEVDISVNNLAPILMSELLYFCGEVDSRIRPLIYAVKKWARETDITKSSPGSWFTNFSLTLLVVYFLQNRPTPVLPPLKEIINIIGAEFTDEYRFEYLMTLPELQAKASLNKESIAVLLQEFLLYLGSHPFEDRCISLMTGSAIERSSEFPVWIQYPLEEDLNVSKNVSQYELWNTCRKARASAKFLTTNLNAKSLHLKDLSILLGIAEVLKLDENKSKRVDVKTIMGRDDRNVRKPLRRIS
nr:poly(A) RNA polymerase, mitochondrial isoform X1 [Parasteatoda tepidariorum]